MKVILKVDVKREGKLLACAGDVVRCLPREDDSPQVSVLLPGGKVVQMMFGNLLVPRESLVD